MVRGNSTRESETTWPILDGTRRTVGQSGERGQGQRGSGSKGVNILLLLLIHWDLDENFLCTDRPLK